MLLLEQGKKYTCINQPSKNFKCGNDYLAITSHQLLDEYAVPVDVRGWVINSFFKVKDESVSHPSHYNKNGIECLDVIKAFYGEEAFEGFCIGNVLKYAMRYKHKGNPT